MRRRGAAPEDAAASGPSPIKRQLSSTLKALDVYSNSKIAAEFTTAPSAASSRLARYSYGVMLALFLCELRVFARSEERDHVVVDRSLGERLRIRLDVTFPALTCAEVHLDAMDVAGDYHPYMEQHMSKQRLDEHGAPLRPPSRAAANANAGSAECLSCYGAESPEQPCCATCDDLLRAYGNKGWSSAEIKLEAPQCADDRPGSLKETKGERGCRLAGWLEVNKVAGNVHIAMGESAVQNGRFIHQFDPTKAHAFNVSHVVNELRFGDRYDGMAAPLEGAARYVSPETGTGLFQYFIKLVPTLYKAAPGAEPMSTVRYSYTQRFRPLQLRAPTDEPVLDHHDHARASSPTAMLPGVFFVYDFSAFMVEVTRYRNTVSHLLVRVCAIVGGVSTVVTFIDWVIRQAKARKLIS
mmetsp:Transcript_27874/g.83655  ORF Transcript_27874/g.83655 Transcript_27874/m.83655 type:complete len:411 (-) Transcript_27874:18-1250(-)